MILIMRGFLTFICSFFLLFNGFSQNNFSDSARLKYNIGAIEEALELTNQKIAVQPENFEAWLLKGDCLQKQEEFQASILAYNTAEKINSSSVILATNYGSALISAGQYKRALEKLEYAISLDPTYAPAQYYAGNAAYFLLRNNRAIMFYQKAVELDTTYKEAYYMMAASYAEQQKFGEALGLYEKVLALDPDLTAARYNIAVIYYTNQEYKTANKMFSSLKEVASVPGISPADFYFFQAETKYYSGEKDEACASYKKAMELGDADAAEIYNKYCVQKVPREEIKRTKTVRMAF